MATGEPVAPTAKGGKRGLRLTDIVGAAVSIADAEGLAEVSMGNVAQRVGYTTMALYRHVSGKSELVELMLDAAIGLPTEAILDAGSWREGLTAWAGELTAVYRRRPWMLEIPISGAPALPNGLRWLEIALVAMRETPLAVLERFGVVLAVSNLVRGNKQAYADLARIQGQPPDDDSTARESWEAILARTLPMGEFPEVRKLIELQPTQDDSIDEHLQFGLGLLLDGVEIRIARIQSGEPPTTT